MSIINQHYCSCFDSTLLYVIFIAECHLIQFDTFTHVSIYVSSTSPRHNHRIQILWAKQFTIREVVSKSLLPSRLINHVDLDISLKTWKREVGCYSLIFIPETQSSAVCQHQSTKPVSTSLGKVNALVTSVLPTTGTRMANNSLPGTKKSSYNEQEMAPILP